MRRSADSRRCSAVLDRTLRDYEVGGYASVRALERILETCGLMGRKRDSRRFAALVHLPRDSHRRRSMSRIAGYSDGVAERFGVPFVECRASLPDSLMGDIHHVRMPEGTIVFTRCLARDVLGPWLRGRSTPFHGLGLRKPHALTRLGAGGLHFTPGGVDSFQPGVGCSDTPGQSSEFILRPRRGRRSLHCRGLATPSGVVPEITPSTRGVAALNPWLPAVTPSG